MVKFLLPRYARMRAAGKYYRRGNHARSGEGTPGPRLLANAKILIEFDSIKFDENLRRIRVDFGQKHRFIANNSFKPVCYGLVQRRWDNRQG